MAGLNPFTLESGLRFTPPVIPVVTVSAELPDDGAVDSRSFLGRGWGLGNLYSLTDVQGYAWWRVPFVGVGAVNELGVFTSIDTGSLLDTVDAPAIDVGFNGEYSVFARLNSEEVLAHREVTRSRHDPNRDLLVYPRPTQNPGGVITASGATILTLMARAITPRIEWNPGDDRTAKQAIEYVFNFWKNDAKDSDGNLMFPWFDYAPVPDLRTLTADMGTPADYRAAPEMGRLTVRGLLYARESGPSGREYSMLDVLEDLLSPFPGTVWRQDEAGRLQIVPAYGPDADDSPINLEHRDIVSISEGKPDLLNITNRWTVQAYPVTEQENVGVLEPAWFQIGGHRLFGRNTTTNAGAIWYTPPNRANLQPPITGSGPLQAGLKWMANPSEQLPAAWVISEEDQLVAGDGIKLRDSGGSFMLNAAAAEFFSRAEGDGPVEQVHASKAAAVVAIHNDFIPFTGQTVDVVTWQHPDSPLDRWVKLRARWSETAGGVIFTVADWQSLQNYFWATGGWYTIVLEVALADATTAIKRSTSSLSGQYGVLTDGDFVPAPGGGNAIKLSQDVYGVVEKSLTVEGYDVRVPQLEAIATGGVLRGLQPMVTRTLSLTAIGSAKVRNEHVGRVVSLPTGEVGVLVGRQYRVGHAAGGVFSVDIQVEIPNPSSSGAVHPAPSTEFLQLDSGEFWMLDDGQPSKQN